MMCGCDCSQFSMQKFFFLILKRISKSIKCSVLGFLLRTATVSQFSITGLSMKNVDTKRVEQSADTLYIQTRVEGRFHRV